MSEEINIETLEMSIDDLKLSGNNPRTISKKDFDILKRSIKDFPSMLEVREVVVDENNRVLGGHQRIKALQAQGKSTVRVKRVEGWTDEQKDEFMIKDNIANGDWDNDKLANEWDKTKLEEWGLPLKIASDKDYEDLLDVAIPHYTPSEICPETPELADFSEVDELERLITKLKPEKGLERILRARACYFTDWDFQKIADYYASADEKTQELMRRLGLVIVIPKEAYEKGMCDFKESFNG